jgi:hypothetical protein
MQFGVECGLVQYENKVETTEGIHLLNLQGENSFIALLEILSFATSHYATGMQLIVVCNYLGHVCNYKFGIV